MNNNLDSRTAGRIIIFTDGSSRGNPGPGGWGAVIVDGDHVCELGGAENPTTNNRMEIMASIKALTETYEEKSNVTRNVVVYTDSSYLINGITKWVFGWIKNGWNTTTREAVVNQDLWENLHNISKNRAIEWKYIGGHSGVPGNERCDEIATKSADGLDPELYVGNIAGYKVKDILSTENLEGAAKKAKAKSKSNSKVPAYSYISMVAGKIQTHKTWAECESRVKGKSGARFKKALSQAHEVEVVREFSNFIKK